MRLGLLVLALILMPLCAMAQDRAADDRGFIQGLLEDALSGPGRSVRIEGFEGALSARATIETITVADRDGVWLTLSDVALVWTRSALLNGRIEIDEITVDRIALPRAPLPTETDLPSPEARGSFSLPDLPVSVRIDALNVGRAELGAPLFGEAAALSLSGRADLSRGTGSAELAINRLDAEGALTLDGAFDNASRQLRLDLSLDEPEGGIAVRLLGIPERPSLRLRVDGNDPITAFEARVQLATAGEERLAGTVTLQGDQTGTAGIGLDVGGDLAPVFAPAYRDFLGDSVALKARGSRSTDGALSLEDFTLRAAALRLTGSGRIAPDGWPERLALDGRIVPPEGDRVILPLPGGRSSVASVTLSGQFDAARGDSWQLTGAAQGLRSRGFSAERLAFSGAGEIGRRNERVAGTLQLNGTGLAPADPALARAIGPVLAGRIGFDWSRGAPLRLADIDLGGADYGLTGALNVSGLNGPADLVLEPDARLEARDLSRFAGLAGVDLSGSAQLGVSGSVAPLTGLLSVRFDGMTRDLATGIGPVDPLVTGEGRLALGIQRDTAGTRITPLAIVTSNGRITGEAVLRNGASRADLAVEIPDLAVALPDLSGAATLDLSARQTGDVWDVTGRTDLPGATVADLSGQITRTAENTTRAEGRISAEIGRLSAFSRVTGRSLAGSATLSASGETDLSTGAYDVDARGRTTGLRFDQPMLAPLFSGTTAFELSAARDPDGRVRIDTADLTGPGLSADLSGTIDGAQSAIDYRLSVPDLGRVVAELPGAATLTGTARRDGGPWQVAASGTGPGGLTLTTDGTVSPDGRRLDLSLSGGLPLALANPQLNGQTLSGRMRYDVTVLGPPALRSVSGRLSVAEGRVSAPALNIAVEGISGPITLAGGQARADLAGNIATGGRVTLTGPVALAAPFNADLGATITAATLRDRALYEAGLGGRVTLTGPLEGGARIGGQIALDTVELRIPQLGPSYSPLDGLRHIAPDAGVRRTLRFAGLDDGADNGRTTTAGPRYPIDLLISAPNRLFVRGRGLDAELGGELRLTGTTDDIVPVGQFDLIRGRLDLLARRLTLTEGAVLLRGSFDPVIRFAAATMVDDTEITVRLDGLASAPELSVSSVPDLPQDEALSLFLFGREATSISPLQAIRLAAAIRTLAGSGPGFTENIRLGLGVDDFDISTDADGKTQARVGAYLSENIYSDVTVNSEGDSQINLNLDVTPSVTVRGRVGSDGDSGVGVFWERDY